MVMRDDFKVLFAFPMLLRLFSHDATNCVFLCRLISCAPCLVFC